MPAMGQSGRKYQDSDILVKSEYDLMKEDVLWSVGAVKEQVFPVRHPTSPHFRRFRVGACIHLVDAQKQRSVTHMKCIEFMLKHVRGAGIRLSTPTFENGLRDANGQVLLDVPEGNYSWWSDTSGTRIPVGYGRYIQPDLCGRVTTGDAFAPTLRFPNLIIEIIDTHYPEEGTLYELIKLSTQNHVVALYFIKAPGFSSYWSQLETPLKKRPTIRAVHLLVDGSLVLNGIPHPIEPPTDRKQFSNWYVNTAKPLLDDAIARKNRPHPATTALPNVP